MKKKPGVLLYFEHLSCLKDLSDAQVGRLLRAALHYGETWEEPELGDDIQVEAVWPFLRLQVELDDARYLKRVERQRKKEKRDGE